MTNPHHQHMSWSLVTFTGFHNYNFRLGLVGLPPPVRFWPAGTTQQEWLAQANSQSRSLKHCDNHSPSSPKTTSANGRVARKQPIHSDSFFPLNTGTCNDHCNPSPLLPKAVRRKSNHDTVKTFPQKTATINSHCNQRPPLLV